MAKAVKLKDIADKLNVSTVTVSKALSDQKGVSRELRSQIKQLAHEMGYVPLSASKTGAEAKSYNIGVLVSDRYFDQTQSFYWLIYQELATRALTKNCFTMLEVVTEADELSCMVPRLIEGDKVNGIVIIGLMNEDYLTTIEKNAAVPVLHLDFYNKKCACDSVVSNNFLGMYQMTDYLCSLGHKKIAYVGTLFATDSITDRYFGYCKALAENNIPLREDYVIDDRFRERGSKAGFRYELPEDMPTAFACNCDVTALEVISLLNERGYRVPEDISVVGFDNYAVVNVKEIRLTTYAVDVRELARRAIKILARKMAGDVTAKGISVVEGKPVIGETTGPAKRD